MDASMPRFQFLAWEIILKYLLALGRYRGYFMTHLNEDLHHESVDQGLAYFVEFRHSPSLYRVPHMPFGKFPCCSDYT